MTMFDAEILEDETRERPASPPRNSKWPVEREPEAKPAGMPKHSVCLKTDGRHFFFAPSVWSA
jgi:hypothetical protein